MGSWTASALRSARRRDRTAIQPVQYGYCGPLAQRLEQRTHNPLVEGSNPSGPTNNPLQFNSLLLGAEGACCPSSAGVPGSVPVSRVSARARVAPAQLRKMEAEAKQVYFSEPPEPLFLLLHRNHVREDCCAPRAVDAVAVEGSGLAQRQISEQVGFGGFLGSGRAVVRTRHQSVPAGNREKG